MEWKKISKKIQLTGEEFLEIGKLLKGQIMKFYLWQTENKKTNPNFMLGVGNKIFFFQEMNTRQPS